MPLVGQAEVRYLCIDAGAIQRGVLHCTELLAPIGDLLLRVYIEFAGLVAEVPARVVGFAFGVVDQSACRQ